MPFDEGGFHGRCSPLRERLVILISADVVGMAFDFQAPRRVCGHRFRDLLQHRFRLAANLIAAKIKIDSVDFCSSLLLQRLFNLGRFTARK